MNRLNETVSFIKTKFSETPVAGVVLGSGLGNLTKDIDVEVEIPYEEIPNFPVSTVKGHQGKLIFGKLGGKTIVAMAGRFHFYEGYAPSKIIYPIQVMKLLGISTVFLSNASGGVNTSFKVGDLMIIKDHISFFTVNPLIGPNEEELGTRFPDMSEPYNKALIAKAKDLATKFEYDLKEGVYVGVTGPTFETHAEYRLIKAVGGDVVGMSTVQEVIAARHMGIDVFALSVVTDMGIRDNDDEITHEEVLAAANAAEPKMTAIFKGLIEQL